jgi:sortase A
MRLVLTQDPVKLILRWTQRLLFTVAAVALGYCAYVLIDASEFQTRESRKLESQIHLTAFSVPPPPTADGLIGRIEVPRLGLSAIVMEGTSTTTLRRAAGHIAGTALPGQRGNVGIAGHRDTFFLPLRNIRDHDIVTLTTFAAVYRYRVVSTSIVSPADLDVLNSDGHEILTLVTCYPFNFVGSAQDRFIVRAERVI